MKELYKKQEDEKYEIKEDERYPVKPGKAKIEYIKPEIKLEEIVKYHKKPEEIKKEQRSI